MMIQVTGNIHTVRNVRTSETRTIVGSARRLEFVDEAIAWPHALRDMRAHEPVRPRTAISGTNPLPPMASATMEPLMVSLPSTRVSVVGRALVHSRYAPRRSLHEDDISPLRSPACAAGRIHDVAFQIGRISPGITVRVGLRGPREARRLDEALALHPGHRSKRPNRRPATVLSRTGGTVASAKTMGDIARSGHAQGLRTGLWLKPARGRLRPGRQSADGACRAPHLRARAYQ